MTVPATDKKRLIRILRLINLLQHGDGWSVDRLTCALDISRRTFYRDLTALRESGIGVIYSRDKGYSIPQSKRPSLLMENLSTQEILGLLMLGKVGMGYIDQPMVDHGLTALYRSIDSVSPDIRDACKEVMARININHHEKPKSPHLKQLFFTMMKIIDKNRNCTIAVGEDRSNSPQSYKLLPENLVLEERGWVVRGVEIESGAKTVIDLAAISTVDYEDN